MLSLLLLREAAAEIWWGMIQWMDNPADMARRGFASRHIVRVYRDWIVHLEKLVRRIVYLAALELELSPVTHTAGWGEPTPSAIPASRPSLRFMRRSREARPDTGSNRDNRRRTDPDPRGMGPARLGHLARRLEALRHAIWHTRPHALRLARRLERLATANQPLPQLVPWRPGPPGSGGACVTDRHLAAIEPLILRLLARRGALIDPHEEPG